MSFLEEFIVSYPDPEDEGYNDRMGSMREFRDMLYKEGINVANNDNADDPFFRNYQMLVGRWLAPWTNNRTMLIRWDPGVGKTRAALSFAAMWMRYSGHKKAMLLSDQEIVHKALDDEVSRYNRFDVELATASYIHGRRAHGKIISATTRLRKHGFEKGVIVRFLNAEMKEVLDTSGHMITDARNRDRADFTTLLGDEDNVRILTEHLRHKYAGHVFIIDEVHSMRYSRDRDKQSYKYLMIVLDAVRDICPILFLTATPIENSWKDAFSVVSMMYGPEVREDVLSRISSMPDAPLNTDDVSPVLGLLRELAMGKVSYRDSVGVVPDKVYVPPSSTLPRDGIYTIYNNPESGNLVTLNFMYPVFMGMYQSTLLSIEEIRRTAGSNVDLSQLEGLEESRNDIYATSRLMYDVVGPPGDKDGEVIPPTSLIVDNDGIFTPGVDATLQYEDEYDEEYFKVEYTEDGDIDTDRGLGRYSIKYATMVHMLNDDQGPLAGMAGYVHTLWVQRGIKIMAASLAANGWDQYAGSDTITAPGPRPRFAVIHGGTTTSVVDRIIETFNSPTNRDGSILRVVLGSKKSGISISFINARFFLEMSSDFNKSKNIQSQGRVLRANALMWTREIGLPRDVIIMNLLALPFGSDKLESIQNGRIVEEEYAVLDDEVFTLEEMANVPEEEMEDYMWFNPYTVEVWMYYLSEIKYRSGMEVMDMLRECSIETIIEDRLDMPVSIKNDALLYGSEHRRSIKGDILSGIKKSWNVGVDINDMYTMRSVAELISSNTLALNKYGMPRPVQSHGEVVSAYRSIGCVGSQCSFNITYDRNFFITGAVHKQEESTVLMAIDAVISAPREEYDLYAFLGSISSINVKMTIIEIAIAMPSFVPYNKARAFNAKRRDILSMYKNYWDTYLGGRVMHILWYGIRQPARIGLNARSLLRTRELLYDKKTMSSSKWQYLTDISTESVFLTSMSSKIADKERDIAMGSIVYGFYVHMSIIDGMVRFKYTNQDGVVTSVSPVTVSENMNSISSLMDMKQEDVVDIYRDNAERLYRDVYYMAKEKDILLVR